VEAYPASIVVDYFANKYGLSGAQCRAYEGTRDVVDRITQPVERVITSATITRVDAAQPFAGGRERALVTWRGADGRELSEEFDEVVLAMQANASLRVLKTRELSQIEALASFKYESKRSTTTSMTQS
jgi:predicted NAD/FAD-binding protein